MSTLDQYRKADAPLPDQYNAWQVFGAGIENVGRDGKPVTVALREPAANEVMLRVDALGLCLSDMKIIKMGGDHPRLRGRDLSKDPTVLGHECAATVVKVGEQWKNQFKVGQRYIVQADIYYKGIGYAFGYLIPGGLAQYCYLDERALAGDEGCYLLPVKSETGYSQSALSEPWACVEMSYNLQDRFTVGEGPVLVVSDEDLTTVYEGATHIPSSLEGLLDEKFDTIIVFKPTPVIVETLANNMSKDGIMFLVGSPAEDGVASLDIGRIHYEGLRFYGGGENEAEIEKVNSRQDLLPGGRALFIGAGGPMGQMHVQRSIEIANGPKCVVVTDLDRGRLDHIVRRFGSLAKDRGVELITYSPTEFESPEAMDRQLASHAVDGYDDIVILAPLARLVPQYLNMAADGCLVNVFAGVGIGSMAPIKIEDLCRGIKIIGSSGSRISDLRKVLQMVEGGELNTNLSIAAIGGLNAAREGLEAVRDAKFPGKTVIYPQIPDLPLTPLEKVAEVVPELKEKLGADSAWTIEAEETLLEKYV
ncbi:MAG: hypothetical protein AMXMBFR84_14500 [Candidatus Hydrogenedentota bacterium]